MTFKPFGNKYNFSKEILIKDFPDFLHDPIEDWLWRLLKGASIADINSGYLTSTKRYIKSTYINNFQIVFREVFPQEWKQFTHYLFSETDRLCNFIAYCLQNFVDGNDASELEYILSKGGSGYSVIKTEEDASEYKKGVYDLTQRVSPVVKDQSYKALNDNDILKEAWLYCYSRNPDYEKVVSRSCDFLEGYLGKLYFPNDGKPQLKKFVHSFEQTPLILNYKGDTVVDPKNGPTSLLKEASNIRGQHINGKGRRPTKQEAEFVLHTTIYIWNLHQK